MVLLSRGDADGALLALFWAWVFGFEDFFLSVRGGCFLGILFALGFLLGGGGMVAVNAGLCWW